APISMPKRWRSIHNNRQRAAKPQGSSKEAVQARSKHHDNVETAEKGEIETTLTRMGTLRQQGQQLILCYTKARQLIQFRERSLEAGKKERTLLESLRPDENIVPYLMSLERDPSIFLGYKYCRFTLLEIIHVHMPLRLPQMTYIAQTVMDPLLRM
ncbi:MAG: hypothetical protein Q9162_007940, partial [Coniocarpon cinnabarinum]